MRRLLALSVIGLLPACMLIAAILGVASLCAAESDAPDPGLQIVIIRHAEKPEDGQNLSCAGFNRSLQLPKVLHKKFGVPDRAFVPTLECGKSTKHARMFQTVTPLAVKYDLKINSAFAEEEVDKLAQDVLGRKGTVLIVWEHSRIPDLARALKVERVHDWDGKDFDSIWVITYPHGKAIYATDKQDIIRNPTVRSDSG